MRKIWKLIRGILGLIVLIAIGVGVTYIFNKPFAMKYFSGPAQWVAANIWVPIRDWFMSEGIIMLKNIIKWITQKLLPAIKNLSN